MLQEPRQFLDMFIFDKPNTPEMGMSSEQKRLSDMRGMNGMQFDTGERSQGDQEAEQRMTQNEKTGILQKFVDFLNRGPFPGNENDPRTPTGSKLIMGPDGQMYDENFIKTIPGGFNNMPEIQRRKKLFESLP